MTDSRKRRPGDGAGAGVAEESVFSPLSDEDTRSRNLAALAASGIFQADYYVSAYADLAALDIDPLVHFYDYGCAEGRRPNFYVDLQWYLNRYPDIATAGINPLLHYVLYGEAEGRQPSILFNPMWYREQFEVPEGRLALAHYLEHCATGAVSPLPEFDARFYARHSADVIAAAIDPFQHYVTYGYTEGRAPSEEFDGRWYAKRYLNGDFTENPFLHWLQNRHDPGVYGKMPAHETSIPREVKRYTRPAAEFEEFRALPASAPRRAKLLAFYLPQFHAFPENDSWWGRGFTEWTNLSRGLPRFRGHYQPRVPRDLGFYGLNEQGGGETMQRQAALAREAGIHGFVFYYYWFNRKRLMDAPLERLLRDRSIDLPFALMWANENWTRRWDGSESELLIGQDYRPLDDEAMLADFVRHFKDPRYIRLGGRPLLMVYRPGIIPDAANVIARWRRICRERFGEEPLLFMAQSFDDLDPRVFGLDGAVEFPPHKLTRALAPINAGLELLDQEFQGKVYSYDSVIACSLEEAAPAFPLIKTVVPSWDNDARRQGSGLVITDSTPAKYQAWLNAVVARAERTPVFDEPLVCINAWNEWCEGAYLEPDLHFGAAYLNATGRAVVGIAGAEERPHGVLLIGHDAFPGGSQTLLWHFGRQLQRRHGLRVEYLLLEGGQLQSAYEALAPTRVLHAGLTLDAALADSAARGMTRAILNTSASGKAAAVLQSHGIAPAVLLVHEMPRILREKQLQTSLRSGFLAAHHVIFPGEFVRAALVEALGASPTGATVMLPQGSYKTLTATPVEAAQFAARLGIGAEPLVLGVGYADMRKGFDLFLQVWRLTNRTRRVHFCWAGSLAPELDAWLAAEIAAATASGTFHLPGPLTEVAPAYAASTALLLTSREDPFPTVVLEALSMGKPVIAFAGTGGIPELLESGSVGVVVPYADPVAMAEALERVLEHPEPRGRADARRELIDTRFHFPTYVSRVLAIASPELPRISVVLPNYNYARYLPERLASIFRQTHPVHELLVLDDASTDDSVEVIGKTAADWQRDIQLVVNRSNSGSVFEQWRKAAEMAGGDWVWIAEADDSAAPGFLSALMAAVGSDAGVVLAFSDSSTMHADGSPQWESYKAYYGTLGEDTLVRTERFDGAAFVARYLAVKNLILNVSAVLWRRAALLAALGAARVALREYKMAGDWQLYLQALSVTGARLAYEATPLNVHRRHEQSVTHALDAKRHLAEIERCQEFARRQFTGLPVQTLKTQKAYLAEAAAQLSLASAGSRVAAPRQAAKRGKPAPQISRDGAEKRGRRSPGRR